MARLCGLCQNLDLAGLRDDDGDMQDLPHQPSFHALELAAPKCTLCTLFLNGISAELDDPVSQEDKKSKKYPIVIRGRAQLDDDYVPQGVYMLTVRWNNPAQAALFWCSVYADDEDERGRLVHKKLVEARAIGTAEQSVDMLRGWIFRCDAEHRHACCPKPTPLPTRVIDVESSHSESVRLFVSNGLVAPYITLSHCWGVNPHMVIRTTTKTLNDHLKEIPLANLPKTFREAVQVTRAVGIRYLWIDSLCIVQDDGKDWERESAVMGDIYHNSYLTIAASGSPDSGAGCFLPRGRDTHSPVKYTVTDEDGETHEGLVHIRPRTHNFRQLPRSVLHSRAWVLQERLLSPRTVHFDTDQTLWECRSALWAEDHTLQDMEDADKLQFTAGEQSKDFIWDWYQVVQNFTRRGITKGSDRLPALSGLARTLEPLTGDKYIAGLWESHLALGLLWRRTSGGWMKPAAEGYRAPSWTWASMDGEVGMHSNGVGTNVLVRDISVTVQPSTLDPRGQLASGWLTLTGMMKLADQRVPGDYIFGPLDQPIGPDNDENGGPSQWLRDDGAEVGKAFYDERRSKSRGRVHCLRLAVHANYIQKWYGLLLEPTENPGEFRRLGMFEGNLDIVGNVNAEKSWFDDGEETTVKIV